MTWRDKTVAAILLIVARMLADDPAIREEIKHLATHISVHAPQTVTTLKLEEAK